MIKNFFKVGIRNILKQKFYAIINILGLTIGITAAIFIVIYVFDELGYDQFHSKIDRMYRVGLEGKLAGQEVRATSTCPPLAAAMKDNIPEVEQVTRLWNWNDVVIRQDEKVFTEDEIFLADSTFFEVFTFPLIIGNKKTALKEPNSVVINRSIAEKYFGDLNCLGEILQIGNQNQAFKITGVTENPPSNSHIKYNFIMSIHSIEWVRNNDNWLNNNMQTYFTIHEGSNLQNVQNILDQFVVDNVGPAIQKFLGISLQQFLAQDGKYGYFIDPVKGIHLYSRIDGEYEPPGDIKYVYIFSAIGIFIIIIAAINFMNLSTARSAGRAREVGMRKTFGSSKKALMAQFLTESLIYSILAMIFAVILLVILLPQFNLLAAKTLSYSDMFSPQIVLGMLFIMVSVGLLAGLYPAFYLTSFKITNIIKGNVAKGMKGGTIRGVLVVLQFAISIFLIISTALVYKQLKYTQNKNLGFDKENAIVIRNTDRLGDNKNVFKQLLMDENQILTASYANHIIPGTNNTTIFRKAGTDEDHIISTLWADYEHAIALGLSLKEGRFFSRDFPSDSMATVINEATAREMGWENPLNQELISFNEDIPIRLKVVGVINDFNYQSLKEDVRPLIFRLLDNSNNLVVRFQTNPAEVISLTQMKWKEIAPDEPFEYEFLDEKFTDLYRSEQKMGSLFTVFTVMAIFISCLGLFGLAAFTAEQKTKEIGIRKVLGASGINIITLLSREFTRYVFIAFLLSIIPAYYFINQWLQEFVYRVGYGFEIFLLGGVVALFIAIITVSYQSVKASLINPADSLKYE